LELSQGSLVDLAEADAARLVQGTLAHFFEELADHRADAHELGRLLDRLAVVSAAYGLLSWDWGRRHHDQARLGASRRVCHRPILAQPGAALGEWQEGTRFEPAPVRRRNEKPNWCAEGDVPGTTGDLRAMEGVRQPPRHLDLPEPGVAVKGADLPRQQLTGRAQPTVRHPRHGTIFLIGSSIMSEAPASFSSGISLLIASVGTTVSTA